MSIVWPAKEFGVHSAEATESPGGLICRGHAGKGERRGSLVGRDVWDIVLWICIMCLVCPFVMWVVWCVQRVCVACGREYCGMWICMWYRQCSVCGMYMWHVVYGCMAFVDIIYVVYHSSVAGV